MPRFGIVSAAANLQRYNKLDLPHTAHHHCELTHKSCGSGIAFADEIGVRDVPSFVVVERFASLVGLGALACNACWHMPQIVGLGPPSRHLKQRIS